MIGNLPAYSDAVKDQIILSVVESISSQRAEVRKYTTNKEASLYDRSFGMFVETSAAFLDAGFGAAILLVSGSTDKDPVVADLDAQMEKLVNLEEAIRAKSLGIKRVNDSTNTVDVKAEVPNWSKTVGSTLPGWSDPKTRQDLVVLIINQLRTNIQILKPFKDAGGGTPSQTAQAASTALHTEFMLGFLEGLTYAKPADMKGMTATFPMVVDKVKTDATVIQYFRRVKEIFQKVGITAIIATAVASSK